MNQLYRYFNQAILPTLLLTLWVGVCYSYRNILESCFLFCVIGGIEPPYPIDSASLSRVITYSSKRTGLTIPQPLPIYALNRHINNSNHIASWIYNSEQLNTEPCTPARKLSIHLKYSASLAIRILYYAA